ncbi:MAG TPA: ribonuclease HII [Saprospiraceae bacterium]|nr:ribonuclease HII [Saprospiraceae bacterium]
MTLKEILKPFYADGKSLEAGCDEAGRGCLAGPVFASTVILPGDFYHPLLNDSKQTSEKNRDLLREIIEKEAISWAVGIVYPNEIDQINILNASIKAMHLSISQLEIIPEFLLIDGNRFHPYTSISHVTVVKGDSKYTSIAAASILAKTHRDEYMCRIHKEHPQYHWHENKGYPTSIHRQAIRDFGITRHHRKTYKLLPDADQLSLPFDQIE